MVDIGGRHDAFLPGRLGHEVDLYPTQSGKALLFELASASTAEDLDDRRETFEVDQREVGVREMEGMKVEPEGEVFEGRTVKPLEGEGEVLDVRNLSEELE